MTKNDLYAHCRAYVGQRIETARSAMEAAQASANEESKSSAGDKYETGRAMAQNERDRHARLLTEALRLRDDLARLDPDKATETVQPGSLVDTDRGWFYVALSIGKATVAGQDVFIISQASPIGSALHLRRAGDEIVFNRMTYRIRAVF